MYLLLINPLLWLPVSITVYLLLRTHRPKMDKATAAIIAVGVVPLTIVFVARRIGP